MKNKQILGYNIQILQFFQHPNSKALNIQHPTSRVVGTLKYALNSAELKLREEP